MLPGTLTQQPEAALNINLALLPIKLRKPVWKWMLKHRPAVCEWMQGEQCQMMRGMMNATPVLNLNETEADDLLTQIPGLTRYAI